MLYTYKAKISILYTSFASAWNPRYQCAYNIPLTKKTQKQGQKLGSRSLNIFFELINGMRMPTINIKAKVINMSNFLAF